MPSLTPSWTRSGTPRTRSAAAGAGRWILLALLVVAVAGLVAYALTRPGTVTVPSVVGTPEPTATERLEAEGLDVDINPIPSHAPRYEVLEQDPIGGDEVDEGRR